MCCSCCSVRQQKVWVFSLGSMLTLVGVVLIAAWPAISRKLIDSMLVLTPSSYTFGKWEVTPMPIYMTFYLYNWTNPHEVANPDVKPHFEELGPYAFREYKVKEDIVWHDANHTVTFFGRRSWHFDPAVSNGSLDDLVTIPHFPTVTGARYVRSSPSFLRKIINFALNREGGGLTMTHTAIDWIFHGFYSDILDFVKRLHSPLLPIYSSEFAWFYGRNNSKEAEGTFTIHTGKGDLTQMGDLRLWNGDTHTGYWEGECGRVNGSNGDLWAPGKSWGETISIFIYDAARFINLFPQRTVDYRGVEGWLYTSTEQTFDNGYLAPDTGCFCVHGRPCPLNGVIDYSPVALRAPVYMSHPHFYMTDASYRANTTGLSPDPDKHGIHILMEPTLGVPLDVNGQVLISLLVEQDEYVEHLRDLAHNFYAPLFVIQIKATISDELFDSVKFALNVPQIGQYAGIGVTVVGVAMIAVGAWLTRTHKWRGDSRPQETESESQSEEATGQGRPEAAGGEKS